MSETTRNKGEKQMEEKLVLEYIGKNADKIVNKKLNWPAAILSIFLGPIWFFYRKSYLLGVILLCGSIVLLEITKDLGIKFAYPIISFFIYLFTANKLYLWDVKRKVRKIMLSSNNLSEEQLSSCGEKEDEANMGPIHIAEKPIISKTRKKGGTSLEAAWDYIGSFIIVGFAIFILIIGLCWAFFIGFIKLMMEMPD